MTDIQKQLRKFADELDEYGSDPEKILDLERRVKKFYSENHVPEEEDYLIESGYGEMLAMTAEALRIRGGGR